jgi:hypothetical protein
LILTTIAKAVNPELFHEMTEATEQADKLGISGASLFYCRNYTAPQHTDRDEVRGICVQLALVGDKDLDEFSFCQTAYGYYLVTRANLLWWLLLLSLSCVQANIYVLGPLMAGICMALCCHLPVP